MKRFITICLPFFFLTGFAASHSVQRDRAGFLPPDISGLAVWNETDGHIVQEGSGIVSNWVDRETSTYSNASQTTDAAKPKYIVDVFGQGQPGLEFDGTDDFLSYGYSSELNVSQTADLTFFIVFKRTTTSAGDFGYLLANRSVGGTQWTIRTRESAPDIIDIQSGANTETGTASIADLDTHIFVLHNTGASTFRFDTYIDGGSKDIDTGVVSSPSGTHDVRIGTREDGTTWYTGYIAAVITYTRRLTIEEINRVGNYLEKYGSTWTDL